MRVVAAGTGMNDRIIVSLGDSYSSGEGIPPFYGDELSLEEKTGCPDWLAHRSTRAWSGMLTLAGLKGTMSDYRYGENKDAHWFFAACSGAVIDNLYKKQEITDAPYIRNEADKYKAGLEAIVREKPSVEPQLKIFEKLGKKKADYVTITIGGNDLDFKGIVIGMVMNYFTFGKLDSRLEDAENKIKSGGEVRKKLKTAYKDISKAAGKQAKILVVGYPELFTVKMSKLSDLFLFDPYESALVNSKVVMFNHVISDIVAECSLEDEEMKIYFVPAYDEDTNTGSVLTSDEPYTSFAGHSAYSEEPYINEIMYPLCYSIHPNLAGSKTYANRVQKVINELEEDSNSQTDTYAEEDREAVIAFLNLMLKEGTEFDVSAIRVGTDHITIPWEPGVYNYYNRFAIDRYGDDGKLKLIIWEQRYYGAFGYSEHKDRLDCYEYDKNTQELVELFGDERNGLPSESDIYSGKTDGFRECTLKEIQSFCSEKQIELSELDSSCTEKLDELICQNEGTLYSDDHETYKPVLDDLKMVYDGGFSDTLLETGYSGYLEEKWGSGCFGEFYAFNYLAHSDRSTDYYRYPRELLLFDEGADGFLEISAVYTEKNGQLVNLTEKASMMVSGSMVTNIGIRYSGELVLSLFDPQKGNEGLAVCEIDDDELKVIMGYMQDEDSYYSLDSVNPVTVDYNHVLSMQKVTDIKNYIAVDSVEYLICDLAFY